MPISANSGSMLKLFINVCRRPVTLRIGSGIAAPRHDTWTGFLLKLAGSKHQPLQREPLRTDQR